MAQVHLDVDLIELAYNFLKMKGRSFTIVDVLQTAHKILRWSEKNHNRHQRCNRLVIINGGIFVDEKYLAEDFRATTRP